MWELKKPRTKDKIQFRDGRIDLINVEITVKTETNRANL